MNPIVLIPARMAATRLANKPRSDGQASGSEPSGRATQKGEGR